MARDSAARMQRDDQAILNLRLNTLLDHMADMYGWEIDFVKGLDRYRKMEENFYITSSIGEEITHIYERLAQRGVL